MSAGLAAGAYAAKKRVQHLPLMSALPSASECEQLIAAGCTIMELERQLKAVSDENEILRAQQSSMMSRGMSRNSDNDSMR